MEKEDVEEEEQRYGESTMLSRLLDQDSGFISRLQTHWTDGDEPCLAIVTAGTGSGSRPKSKPVSGTRMVPSTHGSGTGRTPLEAVVPALAEAIERSATASFHENQFLWSAADALTGRALDLDTVARCSESELGNPHCSLTLPSKSEPIRWVQGLSLHDGEPILVPAVMVYSHAGWRGLQERFWLPISTGCAAHISYEQAVLSALCEVVERDAISLVWLQQLALPRIHIDVLGPLAAPFWQLYQQSSADIEYHFFDATTDVGLPTIYGIQVSRHHPYARTIVACATAVSFDQALAKVLRDFTAFKRAFVADRKLPDDLSAFTGLLDGAAYMARPEHAHAFGFLLQSDRHASLDELSQRPQIPSLQTLPEILQHLARLHMQVIAIDLTTDEALRVGLRTVRVLIPELQPLSLHTAAQFLAHPRLLNAPALLGYPPRNEAHLNRLPQPFA